MSTKAMIVIEYQNPGAHKLWSDLKNINAMRVGVNMSGERGG